MTPDKKYPFYKNEAEKALAIVTEEMENACKMKVRLRADGKVGKTWYDAH
jgi:DNA polymerase I-like protein with 3'-5' exonuclease and polymerase domains